MLTPWKERYDQPRQHIKKQKHNSANKYPSSQGYGFSSGHAWMWDLDYKESWAPKNWCFWTVVLEKTFESPLDCKEIESVHPKWDQSWVFIERTDVEAETPILWPPHAKNWLLGKPWYWERLKVGGEGDDICLDGWMASPTQWTWVWVTPGVDDGQRGLACFSPWSRKVSDTTKRLNWTELKETIAFSWIPMLWNAQGRDISGRGGGASLGKSPLYEGKPKQEGRLSRSPIMTLQRRKGGGVLFNSGCFCFFVFWTFTGLPW